MNYWRPNWLIHSKLETFGPMLFIESFMCSIFAKAICWRPVWRTATKTYRSTLKGLIAKECPPSWISTFRMPIHIIVEFATWCTDIQLEASYISWSAQILTFFGKVWLLHSVKKPFESLWTSVKFFIAIFLIRSLLISSIQPKVIGQ